jgi:sec-independent protein translocase protein TatA
MGSVSIWHWLAVLLLALLIFGSKKLRSLGADVGGALRGLRDSIKGAKDAVSETGTELTSLSKPDVQADKKEKTAT